MGVLSLIGGPGLTAGRGSAATLRITTKTTTAATTPPTTFRMLSVRGWPVAGSTKCALMLLTSRLTIVLGWAR